VRNDLIAACCLESGQTAGARMLCPIMAGGMRGIIRRAYVVVMEKGRIKHYGAAREAMPTREIDMSREFLGGQKCAVRKVEKVSDDPHCHLAAEPSGIQVGVRPSASVGWRSHRLRSGRRRRN